MNTTERFRVTRTDDTTALENDARRWYLLQAELLLIEAGYVQTDLGDWTPANDTADTGP